MVDPFDKVYILINSFDTLEEVLYELDITPEEVVNILLENGYAKLPDWLEEQNLSTMEDLDDEGS